MDNLWKAFYSTLLTGHAGIILTFWIVIIILIISGILMSIIRRNVLYFVFTLLVSIGSYLLLAAALYR
ncbi:hypothetical protein A2930_00965 [Candidatus Giovannonibacteria bacterium RIFCSPLOWO2_01_FULL_45_34]|uniref:Uncharacterized protein n=1 Tax=Candidatus Giovannonibacteria bacterium RIFCSPLOWO2_01_FULL_45_34 TaxID=1798351 RepID=A0A1F5WY56_9BACT|nr:MAG: hypothetical protein A3C73_00415 [Candidatus Giovannonibacteria bacterium RIFCSPHIGHO2_02_FULL_44_11]OGF80582.1 MAG: hypothetical protein A2930_00965 [Candidatus Giovannonibacteria bacterium RIFCSPLOWO2_01_FULL_45_34]